MKKRLTALALATAMTATVAAPAYAYEYIPSITVDINSTIEAGSDDWEFEVDCNTRGVYFDPDEDVKVTNAPDDGEAWKDGVRPKVTIKLHAEADDDFRFNTSEFKADDVTITGIEPYKVSVSDKSKYVTITLTLDKLEYPDGHWESVLEIEDGEWDEENGIAYWEENEDAESYELRVYRGSKSLAGTIKTKDTEYNLSEHFTRSGEYSFKVRAVYDDNRGGWYESDTLDVDSDEAEEIKENGASSSSSSSTGSSSGPSTSAGSSSLPSYVIKGTWTQNGAGKWMFKSKAGEQYKNKWAAVENPYADASKGQEPFDWFYFDANGHMLTGWVNDGTHYYYLNEASDGTKGKMVTGWYQIGGYWYYFNPVSDGTRGAMKTNTYIGKDYVGADGKWVQ